MPSNLPSIFRHDIQMNFAAQFFHHVQRCSCTCLCILHSSHVYHWNLTSGPQSVTAFYLICYLLYFYYDVLLLLCICIHCGFHWRNTTFTCSIFVSYSDKIIPRSFIDTFALYWIGIGCCCFFHLLPVVTISSRSDMF